MNFWMIPTWLQEFEREASHMILTAEEIEQAVLGCVRDSNSYPSIIEKRRAVVKAQLKELADVIGDVLDEPDDKLRLALGYVWQALLEEIK